MPRCVYMVGQLPPPHLPLFPATLAVHCPFRESQFLWQHPTLVFICRYFFSGFFLSAWLRNENFIFVTVLCVCVLVLFRYVPCAVFFHYSYDPCASYLSVCVCLAWHWQLLLIVFTCNILPKLLPLALSLCTYLYIYIIYIHIIQVYTSLSVANLLGLFPFCLTNSLQAVWQKMIDYNRISITIWIW